MQPTKLYQDIMDASIFVSGIPRSGTTMFAGLLASCDSVEYGFEPPILAPMDCFLRTEENADCTNLISAILQFHLVQDVFLNHLQGRGLNFRPRDATCVFNHKPYDEIMRRWQAPDGTKATIDSIDFKKNRLLAKATGRFSIMPFLCSQFPGLRVIEIRRDLLYVAISLAERAWFSKRQDVDRSASSYHIGAGTFPYFLTDKQKENWEKVSDEGRAARAATCLAEASLAAEAVMPTDRFHVVRYEQLRDNPKEEMAGAMKFCGFEATRMTPLRINDVRKTVPKMPEKSFLASLDSDSRKMLLSMNDRWSRAS